MRKTEFLCTENIGLKDIARNRRGRRGGRDNFSRGTNNVLHF